MRTLLCVLLLSSVCVADEWREINPTAVVPSGYAIEVRADTEVKEGQTSLDKDDDDDESPTGTVHAAFGSAETDTVNAVINSVSLDPDTGALAQVKECSLKCTWDHIDPFEVFPEHRLTFKIHNDCLVTATNENVFATAHGKVLGVATRRIKNVSGATKIARAIFKFSLHQSIQEGTTGPTQVNINCYVKASLGNNTVTITYDKSQNKWKIVEQLNDSDGDPLAPKTSYVTSLPSSFDAYYEVSNNGVVDAKAVVGTSIASPNHDQLTTAATEGTTGVDDSREETFEGWVNIELRETVHEATN